MQREIEWQILHPGMDALLSHRSKTNYADKEKDESDFSDGGDDYNNDSDVEMISAPKKRGSASATTTSVKRTAGATRGRGRGRGTSTAALSMTTDIPSTPSTPSIAPRWPPRR